MLVYKIHPAFGVARLGDRGAFFVGPEKPGDLGTEIAADGTEGPVSTFRTAGRIKRQAARFRVFEYDRDDTTGTLSLKREITADEAQIDWQVDLVNRKAALDHVPDRGVYPRVAPRPRNDLLRQTNLQGLIIKAAGPGAISGKAQSGATFDGKFLGKDVFLGELRTDAAGRLMVLGGEGISGSVPPGRPLSSFANNDLWHDDVADGPVTATVTLPGRPPKKVDFPAWVTVAPPDFARGLGGIVTLYDVMFQAAIEAGFLKPAARPLFRRHIMPMILRAANHRFVHDFDVWNTLPRDVSQLAETGPQAADGRRQVSDRLAAPNIPLDDAVVPAFLAKYLDQYRSGDFVNDLGSPPHPQTVPDDLDRAALEAAVGLNFFPGIEASLNLQDKDLYSEPFRFNQSSPDVFPGFVTEVMAVPWQADFYDCQLSWWPAQRPDIIMRDASVIPGSQAAWADGINSRADMVSKVMALPVVVPTTAGGETAFVQESP